MTAGAEGVTEAEAEADEAAAEEAVGAEAAEGAAEGAAGTEGRWRARRMAGKRTISPISRERR